MSILNKLNRVYAKLQRVILAGFIGGIAFLGAGFPVMVEAAAVGELVAANVVTTVAITNIALVGTAMIGVKLIAVGINYAKRMLS